MVQREMRMLKKRINARKNLLEYSQSYVNYDDKNLHPYIFRLKSKIKIGAQRKNANSSLKFFQLLLNFQDKSRSFFLLSQFLHSLPHPHKITNTFIYCISNENI